VVGVVVEDGAVDAGVLEFELGGEVEDGACTVCWVAGELPDCDVQPAARPDTAMAAMTSMP
jgi:hypothetical protein